MNATSANGAARRWTNSGWTGSGQLRSLRVGVSGRRVGESPVFVQVPTCRCRYSFQGSPTVSPVDTWPDAGRGRRRGISRKALLRAEALLRHGGRTPLPAWRRWWQTIRDQPGWALHDSRRPRSSRLQTSPGSAGAVGTSESTIAAMNTRTRVGKFADSTGKAPLTGPTRCANSGKTWDEAA
jgi:hypothetical protein